MNEIPVSVAITGMVCITLIILAALSKIGKKSNSTESDKPDAKK